MVSRALDSSRGAGWRARVARISLPVWFPALLFAAMALGVVAAGEGVLPGDVAVGRWIQGVDGRGLAAIAAGANAMGETPIMLLLTGLIALALAVRGWHAPAALVLVTAVIRLANSLLKGLAESPRPTSDLVHVTEQADGFGFPSGHVMGVVLLAGALWFLAGRAIRPRFPRLAVQAALGATMLVSGFGRIHSGAHWPSDVVGGYLWGGVLLVGLIGGYKALEAWLATSDEGALRRVSRLREVGTGLTRGHRIAVGLAVLFAVGGIAAAGA
jgi:membrane-associated phospholipid phosphatase